MRDRALELRFVEEACDVLLAPMPPSPRIESSRKRSRMTVPMRRAPLGGSAIVPWGTRSTSVSSRPRFSSSRPATWGDGT
jgi:hypothetical protein